ncbi:hypothetical protein K1719_041148 [Acacia pycnantha]|nr:hypothetical protein K1719_041148 [Acacia pycnantha]
MVPKPFILSSPSSSPYVPRRLPISRVRTLTLLGFGETILVPDSDFPSAFICISFDPNNQRGGKPYNQEVDLHNNNQLLRTKSERNQQQYQHNMNVLASSYENTSEHNNQFDSRAFFQVTGLQPHYPPHDHNPLQLVYKKAW